MKVKVKLNTATGKKEMEVRKVTGRKWDHESFQFGITEWDVAKLWDLVTKDRQVHTCDIGDAYKMIGSIMGVGLTSRKEGLTGEQYANSEDVDPTVPILLVQWTIDPKEGPQNMIVDGWSRVFQAHRDGFRELPCYMITEEEVLAAKAIDDPIRRKREEGSKKKAALAEMVLDLLDGLGRHLDRHQWKKFRGLDLLYSEEVDELAEILESWKEGELEF